MQKPFLHDLVSFRVLTVLLGVSALLTTMVLLQPAPSAASTTYWICQSDSVCGGCGSGLVCARALTLNGSCCIVGGVQCRPSCTQDAPCHAFCPPWF